jgi:hypothetical protein
VPHTHVLEVVDASGVTDIGGLSPQDVSGLADEPCVVPFPRAGGLRIHGTAPARARVAFTGEACAVGGAAPWTPSVRGNELCLVADGPATTDVRVTWGPEATATSWACQKR